jgi:hypothetical protein
MFMVGGQANRYRLQPFVMAAQAATQASQLPCGDY